MSTYVLIHGAWHTGDHLEVVAQHLRARGHQVYTPTLAGNRPGDSKRTTLDQAITSVVQFFEEQEIADAILLGHSYGGMVITGAADRLAEGSIRRLVYWNAFVPRNGDALVDLCPPHYPELFQQLEQADGGVMLPWPIWRDAFINDGDEATARSAYESLNPQPLATMTDKIKLSRDPAALPMPKSYINCVLDIAMPHSMSWHPRLSERLGLFRYIEAAGSHEMCFTDPAGLALAIEHAGRD